MLQSFVGYDLPSENSRLSKASIFLSLVATSSKASPLLVFTFMVRTFCYTFLLFCFNVFVCDHNTHYYT